MRMNYLYIDEDGSSRQTAGKQPSKDELEENYSDTLDIYRFHGNRFERAEVSDISETDEPEYEILWIEV